MAMAQNYQPLKMDSGEYHTTKKISLTPILSNIMVEGDQIICCSFGSK